MGKDSRSEFNIAKHTLGIIYNQALFWVGLLYSPLLPSVVSVKMLIMWYVTEMSVKKFTRPPMKTWRAAKNETWFMLMTFLSILLVFGVHGYTIKKYFSNIISIFHYFFMVLSIGVSNNCGPFRDYDYIYQILTIGVAHLEDSHPFWRVIIYLTKPGAVVLFIVAMW